MKKQLIIGFGLTLFLAVLIFITIFLTAKNKNTPTNKLITVTKDSVFKNNKTNNSTNVSIEVYDSITIDIPPDSYNSIHVAYLYKNELLYGVSLYDPMKMTVIDLKKSKIIKQIQIDRNLFHANQISNLYVHNPDSIFFLSDLEPIIYLVNGAGKMLDQWTKEQTKVPYQLDEKLNQIGFGFNSASYLENPYYNNSSGIFYVKLNPISARDEIGQVDVNRHGIYDIRNRKWKVIFGPYEGTLKEKKEGRYYADMHNPYQLLVDNQIFITYPIDNFVYCYDTGNYSLIKTYNGSFTGMEDFPPPLYGKGSTDYEKLIKLRNKTPFWGPLYYHKNPGLFSRFYNHSKERNKRSLIVFDKEFNVLLTKEFDIGLLNKIIPTDYGYIVLPYDEQTQLDPDHLRIYFLKIRTNV